MKISIKHTRRLEGEYGCQICLADCERPMVTIWREGSVKDGISTICTTCVMALARSARRDPPGIVTRRVGARAPTAWAEEQR